MAKTHFYLVTLSLMLILSVFSGCLLNNSVEENKILVSSEGNGDYTSIQQAIQAESNGSIIQVSSGVYNEQIIVNKSVTLLGSIGGETIIQVKPGSHGIILTKPHSVVNGLIIKNTKLDSDIDFESAGILIHSQNNTISNCTLMNCTVGILIEQNNGNIIRNNHFENNGYGIYFVQSSYTLICDNVFENNTEYGGYVYVNSLFSNITHNIFKGNDCGLRIKSRHNTINKNIFKHNNQGLFLCCSASNNIVFHNSFIENKLYHAQGNYHDNQWFKPLPVGGNYWDNFAAVDNDNDGISDTIFVIDPRNVSGVGEKIYDAFPLMNSPFD